jgi:hypothetical protein
LRSFLNALKVLRYAKLLWRSFDFVYSDPKCLDLLNFVPNLKNSSLIAKFKIIWIIYVQKSFQSFVISKLMLKEITSRSLNSGPSSSLKTVHIENQTEYSVWPDVQEDREFDFVMNLEDISDKYIEKRRSETKKRK